MQRSADYVAVWLGPHALLHCKICGALVLPEPDSERDRHGDYHRYVRDRLGHLTLRIDDVEDGAK